VKNNLERCLKLSKKIKGKMKICGIAKEPEDIDELLNQLQKIFSEKTRPLKDISLSLRTSDACAYLTRFFDVFKSGQAIIEIKPQTVLGKRTFSSGEWRALIGLGTIFSYEVVRLERDPNPGEKADRSNTLMVFKRDNKNLRTEVETAIDCDVAQGGEGTSDGDCLDDACEFPEGKEKMKQHAERERNPKLAKCAKARQRKELGKNICQACKFDFGYRYGDVGKDYVEAHHTIPVSELKPGDKTRLSDIALVCSNCHRMLHRKRPWLSMSQLKDLIKQNQHSVKKRVRGKL